MKEKISKKVQGGDIHKLIEKERLSFQKKKRKDRNRRFKILK